MDFLKNKILINELVDFNKFPANQICLRVNKNFRYIQSSSINDHDKSDSKIFILNTFKENIYLEALHSF